MAPRNRPPSLCVGGFLVVGPIAFVPASHDDVLGVQLALMIQNGLKLLNMKISIGGISKYKEAASRNTAVFLKTTLYLHLSTAIGGPLAVLRDGDLVARAP